MNADLQTSNPAVISLKQKTCSSSVINSMAAGHKIHQLVNEGFYIIVTSPTIEGINAKIIELQQIWIWIVHLPKRLPLRLWTAIGGSRVPQGVIWDHMGSS